MRVLRGPLNFHMRFMRQLKSPYESLKYTSEVKSIHVYLKVNSTAFLDVVLNLASLQSRQNIEKLLVKLCIQPIQ